MGRLQVIVNEGKQVAVVVIFTGYTDGTVAFTQSAPSKDFAVVEACFKSMLRHMKNVFRDKAKCPFNPDNPNQFRIDPTDSTKFYAG